MSFCGSDDILRKLPKPYDISSAVSRALRINSYNRAEATCPASEWPSNSMTCNDGTYASKRLDPRSILFSSTYCEDYLEDIQLDMEVGAWERGASEGDILESEKNVHQLEQFCKFIDSSGEEDLEYLPDGYCHDQRPYSFSEFSTTPRSRQPPRKKRRRTVEYDSSPDASPEKPQAHSEMKYDWNVRLANGDLWKQFDSLGTEMVITKNGRRMFPSLIVSVSGLDPDATYSIHLNILPADNKRYKFLGSEWIPVGRAEKKQVYRQYTHPDSPNVGSFWMEKTIPFKLVKLTNNKNTVAADQVILNSMQKYQPCIRITSEQDNVTQSYFFPESQFIAVTAYQNSKITQLKIDNNPYARAFRDCIPSDGSERKGGHYVLRKPSTTSTRSPSPLAKEKKGSDRSHYVLRKPSTVPHTRPPSPLAKEKKIETVSNASSSSTASPTSSPERPSQYNCTSTDTGFDSGDCADNPFLTPVYPEMILLQDNPYGCPLNYWPDDNSLYNPVLLTPPPLLDCTSSFSEPYLQQSSRMAIESNQCLISPVKGLYMDTDFEDTLIIDVETITDDDVFL